MRKHRSGRSAFAPHCSARQAFRLLRTETGRNRRCLGVQCATGTTCLLAMSTSTWAARPRPRAETENQPIHGKLRLDRNQPAFLRSSRVPAVIAALSHPWNTSASTATAGLCKKAGSQRIAAKNRREQRALTTCVGQEKNWPPAGVATSAFHRQRGSPDR